MCPPPSGSRCTTNRQGTESESSGAAVFLSDIFFDAHNDRRRKDIASAVDAFDSAEKAGFRSRMCYDNHIDRLPAFLLVHGSDGNALFCKNLGDFRQDSRFVPGLESEIETISGIE